MFLLASSDALDSFISRFRLKAVSSAQKELEFWDTYTHELLKNGCYLTYSANLYEMRSLDAKLIAKEENKIKARFFWDFGTNKFRQNLRDKIEYRTLLLQNTLSVTESAYLALNADGKGVFRVVVYLFDKNIVVGIEQIKGYENEATGAEMFLSQYARIPSLFEFVKKELKPKKQLSLSLDMSSADAIKLLLSNMLDEMREQEHGIINNIDSEFLHYYRVYLRKARSLLSQFKGIFADDELIKIKEGLSEIGKMTNHARDLDVYWLKVREYSEPSTSGNFEPFLEFLKNSSDKEYAKLSKFFKSSKYKKTTSELSKLLKNRAKGERANEPLASTASARLGKLHKRILKDGRNLSLQSQDESFHALRIDCKKIRYLLEFFEPLLEPSRAPEAIKLVKNLQTILGNYQDLSVQQHKIIGFADEMVKEQASIPSALLISIGVLVGDLQREQNGCKDKFLKSFEIFSKPQSKALFQALIETAQP